MSALLYLKYRTMINWFRQLREKPGKAVFIALYVIFIGFFIFNNWRRGDANVATPDKLANAQLLILGLAYGFSLVVGLLTCYGSTKNGASFFRQADTQLLFSSPLKPQTVLLYGMLSQITSMIMGSLFILYQIPSLTRAGFSVAKIIIFLLLWGYSLWLYQCIGMAIYSKTYISERRRKIASIVVLSLPLVLLVVFGLSYLQNQNLAEALKALLIHPIARLFPVAGWLSETVRGLMGGMTLTSWMAVAGIALTPWIILFYLYRQPLDYYEDALAIINKQIDTNQSREELAREAAMVRTAKRKVRGTGLGRGFGASAVFFRQLREKKRTRPWLIGWQTIVFAVAVVIASQAFLKKDQDLTGYIILHGVLYFVSYFVSMGTTLPTELDYAQFFILPCRPRSLIFHSTMLGVLISALDFIPALILIGVMSSFPFWLIPLHLLCLTSFILLCNGAQLVTYRIFGHINGTLDGLVLMFLQGIFAMPSFILLALGFKMITINLAFTPLFFLGAALVNVLIFTVSVSAGVNLLKKGPNL